MGKKFNTKWKYVALLLVIFTLTFAAACSKAKEETTTTQEAQKDTTAENQDAQNAASPTEQVQKEADKEAPKRLDKTGKKIAVITFANAAAQEWQKQTEDISFKVLKEAGYDTENTEFKIIKEDDTRKVADVTKQIREFNPNLAIIINPSFAVSLAKSLEGAPFQVVSRACREAGVVDSSGAALKNVTGINSSPADIIVKAANLVTMVNPSIEKKTVFIVGKYAPGAYPKQMVEGQLKSLGITLKAYEVPETEDELYSLVQKYEKDPEIKWVIYAGNFLKLKNGSIGNSIDALTYIRENSKKMNITFIDSMVKNGMFGGVSVDLVAQAEQQMQVAVKLLNGEDIKGIKIEDPKKVFIYYNKMTADKIGVQLPLQALESAYRVFTDYEGNYIK